jgi:serine phosphatase RsbU (regulator of sigma subunit)
VVITEFKLFDQPVKLTSNEITLSYKDKLFSFTFAALDYTIPGKNQYAYKMEGFDERWNFIGENRSAVFSGLPPGEYMLRVRAANNDGVWNREGTSIRVTITPPWWRTSWAYALFLLVLLLFLFSLNRLQRKRLVKRERHRAEVQEARLRAQAAEAQARAMEAEHQRKTHELEEARKLQLSMLPQRVPKIPGIRIAAFMRTASEVGGDYYDFHAGENNTLTAVIGDATGHGLKAGTMVSIVKTIVLTEVPSLNDDLHMFFTGGNRTIREMNLGNLFMGLTLMRLHLDRGKGIIASAGMPPVYRFRQKDRSVEEFFVKAPPIGALNQFSYHSLEVEISVGDTLLLFSDGLPELFNQEEEMFGYDNLKTLFKDVGHQPPNNIIQHLVEAGDLWLKDKPQDDDITFVVLKIASGGQNPF